MVKEYYFFDFIDKYFLDPFTICIKTMTPLFTKDFLSNYLSEFNLSNIPNIRMARTIIENLIEELRSGKLESLKEEEVKSRFINEFFGDVLGFNYGNSNFWTLREEAKSKVDGSKPDGVLGFFSKNKNENDTRAVIEIKDANTDLDKRQNRKDSKSPISQAFEYSTKMGEACNWVIVSNLKEIRFYHSNFQGKYQEFYLDELAQERKLIELLFLFHKDKLIHKNRISSTEQLYKRSIQIKENQKPKHIVDEIYLSIIRFNGLTFIDPNYIANMKPFNILKENVWHYNNGNLLTINPKIYSLFSQLSFTDGSIRISNTLEMELYEYKVLDYETKIESFIKFFNHSQIRSISCIKDIETIIRNRSKSIGFSPKHSFNFSDNEGFTLDIDILERKTCDCISCSFKDFNFKDLLRKLKTNLFEESNISLDFAYGNYLVSINNYKNAYNIYKRLSEKIKNKESFEIEYFIAKLNMKYLQALVLEDNQLEDSFKIREESRNIDLNRILFEEIEYAISEDVRNYLFRIKDEKLLIKTKDKIDELVEKIIHLRKQFDNANFYYSGPNFVQILANYYLHLQLHLDKNKIIYNTFHDYHLLSKKVFKGFIQSYLTRGHGLASFDSYFLIEFIINITTSDFKEVLKEVTILKLNNASHIKLFQSFNNLFTSYFDDGLFNKPFKNRIVDEFLIDYDFNAKYRRLIANSIILLSKIEVSSEEFYTLSKNIISFLKIEDIFSWSELREFEILLNHKGFLFSEKQLEELLKISIERDIAYNNKYKGLIKQTSKSLHKFYSEFKISDKQLIKKALSNAKSIPEWKSVSHLLLVSNDECRTIIYDELNEILLTDNNFNLYEYLIRKKLYDYKQKDYFEKYTELISNNSELGFTNSFINGEPIFKGYTFYNFAILLNILEIDRNSNLLKNFNCKSEFERWLINPSVFDYSKFDVKWLLASNNIYIFQSLNNIEELSNLVEENLRTNFDPKLSEIYYRYLI